MNRRAVIYTKDYLTPNFAESLSHAMGCTCMKELPEKEFVQEALKPEPIYFESEKSFRGTCVVCNQGRCLGRCPNPRCGLLMHHACALSDKPGSVPKCPVCAVEEKAQEADVDLDQFDDPGDENKPHWHEAEVGAPKRRYKAEPTPRSLCSSWRPPFPEEQWPTEEEAKHYGLSLIHI